jgi:uncharacterized protein DUF1828
MEPTYCHSLKDSLLAYFGSEIQITPSREGCVLVLPTKTLDDRYVAVFVERKTTDYFVVHDAGKTSAELHSQGVHITQMREEAFSQMADKLGATFSDGIFQFGCKENELYSAILAIGQCETLGMWHLLGHKPDLTEEPVIALVERGFNAWRAPYSHTIQSKVQVKGQRANHIFDFVSYPNVERRQPIAVKILRPSDDALAKAREYGFLVYDTEKTYFERWLRVAIMTKSDRWTKNAKQLVASLSTSTLEVETGDEESLERRIPATLDQIAA